MSSETIEVPSLEDIDLDEAPPCAINKRDGSWWCPNPGVYHVQFICPCRSGAHFICEEHISTVHTSEWECTLCGGDITWKIL